jgi:acyl-CoA dehydrogenase
VDFDIPADLTTFLSDLDAFIASTITPLQHSHDNDRFFDHRREDARTDWTAGGLPSSDWEALLREATRLVDAAGFFRAPLSSALGGRDIGNLWMAVIREHLASKGLGLFNDLQNEHSVVGNFPDVLMVTEFGTEAQQALVRGRLEGKVRLTFGLTEPDQGSDATHTEMRATREVGGRVSGWRVVGRKMWQTGMHNATHCIVFARTSESEGEAKGITAFVVPADAHGVRVESYEWVCSMRRLERPDWVRSIS